MTHAVYSGVFYFAAVFAAGFALGVVRVIALEPRFGPVAAVLLELPIILAISWVACGVVLRRLRTDPRLSARLIMGAVAFLLLIAAEIALGVVASGRSISAQLDEMLRPSGLLGLFGQALFAVFPILRGRNALS
jgi:hypothetical protein